MPVMSVIVPVYNGEAYLTECVESVRGQTAADWELILVDDGSTDGSAALCADFAARDPRVRVLRQPNAGAGAARNRGLAAAAGAYILFLDADDFYRTPDAFEKMLRTAEAGGNDVVCFGYGRYDTETDTHSKPMLSLAGLAAGPAAALLPEMVRKNAWQSSACIRLVKRETLDGMRFAEGINGEDIEWNAALMLRARRIGLLDEALYAYRVNSASVSRVVTERRLEDLVGIVERLAAAQNLPEALAPAHFGYTAFQYCTLLLNWQLAQPRPGQALKKRAKGLSPLLKFDANPVVRLTRIAYRLLGFDLTGKLMLPFRS